jgi:glutathione S-transferase
MVNGRLTLEAGSATLLKILGRVTSINVRKVRWLADELGVRYEIEDWGNPVRDPRVPEFLALNPNAQVPVIVDDGFVLWESGAVMRYLARKQATPLWPDDPKVRAISDQWLTWQATELNPPWGYAVYALIRRAAGYDDENCITDSLARWGDKMRILDERLAHTGAYAAGAGFTLADIALGLSAHRWYAVPRELPEFRNIRRYYETLRRRDAGARYMTAELF